MAWMVAGGAEAASPLDALDAWSLDGSGISLSERLSKAGVCLGRYLRTAGAPRLQTGCLIRQGARAGVEEVRTSRYSTPSPCSALAEEELLAAVTGDPATTVQPTNTNTTINNTTRQTLLQSCSNNPWPIDSASSRPSGFGVFATGARDSLPARPSFWGM